MAGGASFRPATLTASAQATAAVVCNYHRAMGYLNQPQNIRLGRLKQAHLVKCQ